MQKKTAALRAEHFSFAAILLSLVALCVLAYAPAQTLPFISDDYDHIQIARGYGGVDGWNALLQDPLYRCRAVSNVLAFWIDRWFGVEPLAFNLASLLLHVLNTLLVAALGIWKPIGWQISLPGAAFFAIAEGHQEAVMWFAASPELNVFTFVLAGFLVWVLYVQSDRRPIALYASALSLFVLALLSKESGVILVGLQVLAVMTAPRGRKSDWLAIAPFAGLSLVYFWLGYTAKSTHLHYNDGTFSLQAPFWITIPVSIGRMLWIWGVAAIGVLLYFRRQIELRRLLFIVASWSVITLLPYSFLMYMNRVPSRHTYIASAGLALLVGAAAWLVYTNWWRQRRAVVVCLGGLVVVHNVAYLWIRKQDQFFERARPTVELVNVARSARGKVVVECFPYAKTIAENAVVLEGGIPKERLVFSNPAGCRTWRYLDDAQVARDSTGRAIPAMP